MEETMKPRIRIAMTAALIVGLSLARTSVACTTFCYADGGTLVFGRNYDWNVADGMVFVNKRDVSKRSLVSAGAATWTSSFGSITFNQYGREFPTGGMNEKGLVVELMWLDDTQYPAHDDRGALPTLQWIQYQLDKSATVQDVIDSDRAVRIASAGSAKIHFLVADASGAVATVEFLNGNLVAHRGNDLPHPVLTNDTYDRSVAFARKTGKRTGKSSHSSLDRFARAASYENKATSPANAVRSAFGMLADVAQGDHTKWSIVYDIGSRRVYFKTLAAPKVRWIDVDRLAFVCHRPVAMLDINTALSGDVTDRLVAYEADANRQLVHGSFDQTPFLSDVPDAEREALATYPETTTCASQPARKKGK
jgi:penicillin V acylase-like amidase (Ntn superfamily)